MTKKRPYIILTSIILLGLLADFSPIIYYKISDDPTWLQIYVYDGQLYPTKILKALQNFKSDQVDVIFVPNKTGTVDYTDVFFYDKEYKNYYHTCFDLRSEKNHAYINFIHVCKTKDYPCVNAKAINKDFDFLTNRWTIKRFESLVIDKLNVE